MSSHCHCLHISCSLHSLHRVLSSVLISNLHLHLGLGFFAITLISVVVAYLVGCSAVLETVNYASLSPHRCPSYFGAHRSVFNLLCWYFSSCIRVSEHDHRSINKILIPSLLVIFWLKDQHLSDVYFFFVDSKVHDIKNTVWFKRLNQTILVLSYWYFHLHLHYNKRNVLYGNRLP